MQLILVLCIALSFATAAKIENEIKHRRLGHSVLLDGILNLFGLKPEEDSKQENVHMPLKANLKNAGHSASPIRLRIASSRKSKTRITPALGAGIQEHDTNDGRTHVVLTSNSEGELVNKKLYDSDSITSKLVDPESLDSFRFSSSDDSELEDNAEANQHWFEFLQAKSPFVKMIVECLKTIAKWIRKLFDNLK